MLPNVPDSDLVLDHRHASADGRDVIGWVDRTAALTRPDNVVWCDASRDLAGLIEALLTTGACVRTTSASAVPVGLPALPHAVRERTLIGVERLASAPRNEHSRDAHVLRAEVALAFDECMQGRTMYVVPFAAGLTVDGETAAGVQVTDSAYVAAVLLASYAAFPATALRTHSCLIRAVHSVGRPLPSESPRHADVPWPHRVRPWLARFPSQRESWSFGSAYEPRLATVAGQPLSLAGSPDGVAAWAA